MTNGGKPMTVPRPQDPDFAARVRDSFARQAFMTHIGARLSRIEPGMCEIRLPFTAELTQQHGLFHGGVTGTIADSAAGYAAYSLMPADATVLTVEYKINLLNPGRGDELVARAQVKKAGRTLTVVTCDVVAREGDRETAIAHLLATMLCLHGRTDNAQGVSGR